MFLENFSVPGRSVSILTILEFSIQTGFYSKLTGFSILLYFFTDLSVKA